MLELLCRSEVACPLDEWVRDLEQRGVVRSVSTRIVEYEATYQLDFTLPNGGDYHARITETELSQSNLAALRLWTRTIEEGIQQANRPRMTATEVRQREAEAMARIRASERAVTGERILRPGGITWLGIDFADAPAPDPAADQRARDLFRLVAGAEAFDTLNASKPLPITGSTGTRYTLHRRATFCVERVDDGAKLCAVVPGVPLWDHLLGIKLMVENDEPKFLATANVVPGAPRVMSETWAQLARQRSNAIGIAHAQQRRERTVNDPNRW